MIKGNYKRIEAVPCTSEDSYLFRKMMKDLYAPKNCQVFVRQVRNGDILISETVVMRWRFLSENGKLYLGFYEKPMKDSHYKGIECPLSYYIVVEDESGNSKKKNILVRISKWEAWKMLGVNM